MTCAPGNDFLIRVLKVVKTLVEFDLLLAPVEDRAVLFPPGRPVRATVTATAQGQEKSIEVTLDPVAGDFPFREIDFREEAEKALTSDEPSGFIVPPYDWRDHWPEGKAPITHLAGRQVLKWNKPLERGAEVRIRFPRPGPGLERRPPQDLVLYVEEPPPEEPQPAVDAKEFEGLELRVSTKIQGNVLAGFNKDHQEFLFLRFTDDTKARKWLKGLTPGKEAVSSPGPVTMTKEVTEFKDRKRVFLQGTDPAAEYLKAVWFNLSFTHPGVEKLQPKLAEELLQGELFQAFRDGSRARKKDVGDLGRNDPHRWIVQDPVHAVLTVAADDPEDLEEAVTQHLKHAADHGVELAYRQRGDALTGAMKGREHFGFRDGVSQPGVEGYTRPNGDFDADHPGARIIDRKHFLLQDAPDWMKNGTFQVLRLLGQDVARWSAQVRDQVKDLPDTDYVSKELLAAKLIGRWPSGTPVVRASRRDDRPHDKTGDNDFTFADDEHGERCPKFAHIRTQNPRIGPEDDEHRILRRGIPFGPAYDPVQEAAGGYAAYDDRQRGLCFNAFMANIENQFEFLQRKAIASEPDPPDTVAGGQQASFELRLPVAEEVPVEAEEAPAEVEEAPAEVEEAPAEPKPRELSLRSCVTTLYSVYAFAPALQGLQALATEPPLEIGQV
jgi:Dyp-type peroxidase family